MMEQLGIKSLRPGPSGRSGATNEENYDPAKANPYPDLPDPLTLKNGKKSHQQRYGGMNAVLNFWRNSNER